MITFKEIAPYVITATVIICAVIAIKIKKEDILTIDGIFSVVGFMLGLLITSLNLIYSNNYLISLGPLLAIACLLYLRFRNKILTKRIDFNLSFSSKTLKIIDILYWICILIGLISYHQAPPYYRPPIFFISISLGASLLGLEILGSKFKDNFTVFRMISKILFISLILRASAYFISPYPIGSDPWAHADLIKSFLRFHTLTVTSEWPQNVYNLYYTNYPLAHLYACASNLIGNISIKQAMFIIGAVLALSTIFVYLIVKKITNNINLALLSMLLLNFADFHIQWSIQVIAMSFGIAIYAIIIYLILKTKEKHQLIYTSLLILFLFIIIWTHTVSGFIALISVISLYLGSFIYRGIYEEDKHKGLVVSLTLCLIFTVILVFHWMDQKYPFFESITIGLVNSLNSEAEFLGRLPTITQQHWESILNILGFLVYIFFGIIGSLYCLSRKYANKTKVALVFMLIVLYFVFFVFPVLGMRNIMPYRWPAFIYVSFVLFVGIGFTGFSSMLKSKHQKIAFVFIVLFITSFFMITNFVSDMDSPVYAPELNQRLVSTSSEMAAGKWAVEVYNGKIIADMQYGDCIVKIHFGGAYNVAQCYMRDEEVLNSGLVIWRDVMAERSVQIRETTVLGEDFELRLENSHNLIYASNTSEAFLARGL